MVGAVSHLFTSVILVFSLIAIMFFTVCSQISFICIQFFVVVVFPLIRWCSAVGCFHVQFALGLYGLPVVVGRSQGGALDPRGLVASQTRQVAQTKKKRQIGPGPRNPASCYVFCVIVYVFCVCVCVCLCVFLCFGVLYVAFVLFFVVCVLCFVVAVLSKLWGLHHFFMRWGRRG